jgi:hypothetical protein
MREHDLRIALSISRMVTSPSSSFARLFKKWPTLVMQSERDEMKPSQENRYAEIFYAKLDVGDG